MKLHFKKQFLLLLVTVPFLLMAQTIGGADDIAKTIKAGDAKKLAGYFDNMIEMKILDTEGAYSKTQAEQIIKDFFAKNAVKDFQLKHDGTSDGNSTQFVIGTLTTASGKYRTYIYLKKKADNFVIQELNIEHE